MNGNSIVADTSTLINFLNGSKVAKEFLDDKDIWISGITEIELLSSSNLSNEERKLVRNFIKQLTVVDLIPPVKEIAASLLQPLPFTLIFLFLLTIKVLVKPMI